MFHIVALNLHSFAMIKKYEDMHGCEYILQRFDDGPVCIVCTE